MKKNTNIQSCHYFTINAKVIYIVPKLLSLSQQTLIDGQRVLHMLCLFQLSLVDMDQPLFQPYPSELVFQNFTPAQTYTLSLRLHNIDKVSRQVKLELQDSEFFRVVGTEGTGSKVAPGLFATFTVFFTPQENKDYHPRLVCVTERERFEVPVRAIGPRAILDFRDSIHLPVCPVKASTERTQLVCNVGNSQAKFKLETKSPFSVTPSCGTLDVGESMQVTVVFNPMTIGDHSQDLLLHYHTGEDVYISLYGACEELDIHLESDFVLLKKTYISLANVHKVSLTYSSKIPLKYCWTMWPSLQEEALSLLRYSSVLQQKEEEVERERLLIQCESDPTAIHRLPLLSRALQERRSQAVQNNILALSRSCITVMPAEGEIWPNCPAQFNIVFKPKEAKLYQQTIYCDVTGRESRLPLTIKAEGVGPNLQLNYDLMDMKNVFIGCQAPTRPSAAVFSFSPVEGVVPSGACQIVKVTFHSRILGTFDEDLLLTVTGQPQPLTVTFRGCVIGPKLYFNVSQLNFGDVGFGFPLTLKCSLFNDSSVPITFALRVQGDGLGSPSVTSLKQASEVSRNIWEGSAAKDLHARPVEFTITPATGSMFSFSDVTIEVTLCSNTVKSYSLALVVDVQGVGKKIISLPIIARCVVPDIVVETPVLDFQRCFLNHRYEQQVRLTNTSTLPACYGMLDQVLYIIYMAVVAHKTVKDCIKMCSLICLFLFQEVVLSCIGQGPIVHVQSPQLDFGTIPVLTDITRTLHLSNQSPIPAHFTAYMRYGKSFGRVEPSEGEVPPESQHELRVVAHLEDTLHFQPMLEISIQDSQTHTVPLSATGTGTTIVSDKPFAPNLDLGTYFSPGSCQYHFKLTNRGKRMQRFHWKKDIPEKPVFSLTPSRVELLPGCSVDMVLTGSSDCPKVVRERLVCRGIVGRQGCNELIMSVDVTCRFVPPMLSISSKQLKFYTEKVPGESLKPLYEKLILENLSSLPLSMELSLVEPFSLCEASGAHSTLLKVHYPGHPQQEIVELHAEVHFPNLHFSSTSVDFGCVLNCSRTRRAISITNCSPLPVSYHWVFLDDQKHCTIRYIYTEKYPHSHIKILLVFDISPIYGELLPGEQQQVILYFYGQENVSREAVAQCHVVEGPTYEIKLRGETSVTSYSLDSTHIDFGLQLFDHEVEADVTLRNTGKVGFKFSLNNFFVCQGHIDAGAEQLLHVRYLPGIPEVFEKRLQLQVAFLPLQDILLTGEGVFPRIRLNLPQNLSLLLDVACYCLIYVFIPTFFHSPRFLLPEYVLDFGYAILGKVFSHTVNVTNTGSVAVSFHPNGKLLAGTGFSAGFERVKNLPCGETHTFTVKFDPQGANLKTGDISVVMPIQVTGGPMVQVRLCAVVTVPAVTVSTDTLLFDTVQCDMCQIKTIQLFNHESVPCYWSIVSQKQRPPPAVFRMIPSSGMLSPGERVNVQIRFSPAESNAYNVQLVVQVADSTEQVLITAQGQGEEPQLQFCPPVLELGPCLPVTTEVEAEVIVKNPCSFPIEFYSLEFDTQYLEEEKMLRLMQGYDENNILLLPPRAPGESLPTELLDYYKEYCSQLRDDGTELKEALDEKEEMGGTQEEEKRSRQSNGHTPDSKLEEIQTVAVKPVELLLSEMTNEGSSGTLGQLEMTPVSRAIARHMCVDLSPEGLAARNRRGIAIIVYGAPLTGEANVNTLGNLLPEQLLVDILAERFQRSDCHRGIVIDGLESVYTQSEADTLQVVLKALKNRKHIYVVNLSDSYAALKARERAQRETEEALQKERADREEQWLQELDDDEYNDLPEEEIERIVLEDLGLGPSGPPIPPPTSFSVVPFPKNREQSNSQLPCNCFTFLVSSLLSQQDAKKKDAGKDVQASVAKVMEQHTHIHTIRTHCGLSLFLLNLCVCVCVCVCSLTTFRWIVPANGEVILKIGFYSASPGKFEQTFNFELLGTQRRYQLFCKGICTYPSICKDYMSKVPQMEEGLHKVYTIKPEYFEFGPLLCGKTRDRYKENRYPENMERLVIHNNSELEAEVQFSFQHDSQATTYLLEPPTMTLKPDQKQELAVWAYPTKLGQMKDSVVCSIRDNPELVIINVSCWGVRPELELESKHLHFDRTLLHRQESRSVMLHNRTALPVSWRLQGVEELGDEFSLLQDEGIISPNSSFPLSLHFRSRRPLNIKKILRLEVSDLEKILGIIHTENIQVTAEAYDIALDITPDGCLDFGTIKVFEEAKQSLRLKNQGKYEIAYNISFSCTLYVTPNLESIFTVSPQSGTLLPHDKLTTVQILCRPNTEVLIREQPVLPCQVIEPNIRNGGEPIAILAIKVSVKAVFSRYKITPACDIDFGPLVYGSKKSQSFTIENNGVFDSRFIICRMITDPNRLTMGLFSVYPCTGCLQPGSQQVVTVDCVAEQLGNWIQGLLIDISDRDPSDQPDGIPYRLMAEVCKPGENMASVFEEHHLCQNSSQLSSEQFCNAEGIYVRDENKFIFNKVLVRRTAQARFKLSNNNKVPCVLSLAIKSVGVFDLSATTLSIPSQSHMFAVVTFTPQTMQQYSAVFEVTMDVTSRMTPTFKSKVLEFDIVGEGTLPSVCVVSPALRNSRGSPMLQFKQVLAGSRHTRPVVLLNDGNVPAQVQIDMLDKHGVFSLKAAPGNTCSSIHSTQIEERPLVHRATLRLNVNQQVEFEVSFCSDKPLSVKAKMSLKVEDNQYSNTVIQVTGEAYQGIVSLDNIRRPSQKIDQEDNEGGKRRKEGNYELLNFGDCHVDCPYQESFTMTNHSSSQAVRFEWPPVGPHVFFSPQVGHLHAGCSKEVTVTFCSNQPVTLNRQPMRCKVSKVEFLQPLEQVADWDDRQRTLKHVCVCLQVIKTDPEPCCSVVEGSQRELELRISAVCDYVKFSCNTNTIHFKDTLLYQTRLHQSTEVLTGARPASALASGLSLLMGNPELPPISIEPSIGAIEPGAVQNFSIYFSPLEVAQFQGRLFSSIPNLQDGDQAPCVSVCGRSLLPHCHFGLEDSDYISGNRRNPEFRRPVDPNTRVIEFNSVGLSVPSTRCFSLVNPTSKPYSFKWRCEDTGGSPFCCLNPCGTILPGKKVEVCFEYVAEQLDTVESFWSFVIETLSLSVPFLCVGTTKEPLVYLNRPHLDFGELLVGRKVGQMVDLVNGEEELFHFSVMQSSLLCDDQQSSLILQPMTGTVAPKDRLPLSVSFTPCREGFVSFRLVVWVKKKSEPLALTVKADCFSMSTSVQVEKPEGGLREINPNHKDTLDFGKVSHPLHHTHKYSDTRSYAFMCPSKLLQHLQAKPQNDTIEVGKQLRSSLFFCPRSVCNLRDVRLSIKVKHGPTFTFAIEGRAVAPSLEFSFSKYNFGKCFLYSPAMVPASQTLVISNKGERDISVQCQFRNTSYLEMDFKPEILSPGAVIEAPVKFYPREECRYHEKLTFILNSCVTKHVDILGQGIEMKLEVEQPRQRKVKLGSLMLGQKVKKQVVLDLSFSPVGELNLKASVGSCNVEIQFSPHQHIPPFSAELQAEFAGLLHPLLTIQGCCQGVEVQLDQDHLAFGAVVQRCQARKRIFMTNTGDIGARFQWKTESFPPELSITPAKGYICPDMEVPFEVTFAPVELINDTRYENLPCFVEGSSSPVTLTVTGSCIIASTTKEVVNFVCPVRGSHTQTLPVFNPTHQQCSIRPVVEGKEWSAAPLVILDPLQNKTYEITYRPLSMTADGKKHLGSVFFSFPDGTGVLYSLQGTAEPPKAEDTIVHELPAKTHHTEFLPVHNWLSKQQQFRVLIEILKPDKPDATVSLKGLEYVDVPALAKRDYKMSFFTYREGQYNTKVTFRNEVSGEYLFYLVNFKATSPGVVSTIELVSTVRRTALATVQVENPLTTATCLTTDCKCLDISAPPQHTVPGQSKGSLSFEYFPLRPGESTARLTLFSNDLGYFHYDLLLKALPPPQEKTVHFSTSLGSSHSVLVKFTNHSRYETEYSCKTDCPDFIVDKSRAQVGPDASVEVCFEPHQLGQVRGQLCLSSAGGGEYIFPLHGICLPPKAQGPFSIKTGRSVSIPFKNVFLQTTTFSFKVDNPCFSVTEVDTILSKKTHTVLVSFEAPPGGLPGPWFGKLTISSQHSEGHSKPCSWVYYLKGYRTESS
uniref:HYDIN axonemal central pair apparatus protein n=1 Tax=Sander lucioperca TaxID=283035 RepID=A0A8D0AXJ9_SANLU